MVGREDWGELVPRGRRQPREAFRAVAFADIVDSCRLAERHELLAFHYVRGTIAMLRRAARACGGRVVDEAGDGAFACFPCACTAVRWAGLCHAALPGCGRTVVEAAGLRLRIGMHLGPVLLHGTRLFGRTVNIACRLQQAAKPGETLVSEAVREMVAIHGFTRLTCVGAVTLKHISTPIRAYRLDEVAPPPLAALPPRAMELAAVA